MKCTGIIALLLILAIPAWSATRSLTVDQLRLLLTDLQRASKSDDQVATELKSVDLTEELTASTMQTFGNLVPGPLSTEQIYVLQARSAMLPAPAADRPADPAPDPAAQQALLAKAQAYVAKTYSQLPILTATRMSARFQDGVEAVHSFSGMNQGTAQDTDPLWQTTNLNVRLVNTATAPVESANGIEKPSSGKDKTNWGANNLITPVTPPLPLPTLLQEATASGSLHFLRWERIADRKVAVFDFAVEKKKSKFGIDYCCFPSSDTAGMLSSGIGISQGAANGGTGNLQTVSEW